MNYSVIRFQKENIDLLPQREEPFDIIGRLVSRYDGKNWSISEIINDTITQKTYPDERFNPIEYIDNPEEAAFIAIHEGKCIGSIRMCRRWNGNAFIDDFKVAREYRHKGIGTRLMDAAVAWGREQGLNGVSLETQDDNLLACRFYLKYGFLLGGIDTKSYTHPSYAGETALYFYLSDEKYRGKIK